MRIGIDMRALVAGRSSGVETYTVHFLTELFKECPDDQFILFVNAYHNMRADFAWIRPFRNVRIVRTRIPNKLLNLSLWYLKWPKLDKLIGGVDLFFMPNINFCAVSRKTRLVVTVHDLSFVHYAHTFSLKRRLWHFFVNPRALVRAADHVITVSDATRNDLIQTYHCPPKKITTIHSGIDQCYRVLSRNDLQLVKIKEKYALPYRFIFFLGTVEPRKNIDGLVYAYNALRQHYGDAHDDVALVIAGSSGWKDDVIRRAIKTSPYAKDIHVLGFVAEEDKPFLYNLATVFVYPSFFEGFGFPPLEAMACGVPTITSNVSSLPEVVGNGALIIDPDRPEEITYALHGILSDRDFAQTLAARGRARCAVFSWHTAARQFRALLNEVVNKD